MLFSASGGKEVDFSLSLSRNATNYLVTSLVSLLYCLGGRLALSPPFLRCISDLPRRTHRRLSWFPRTGSASGAWPTLPLSCALPPLRRRSTSEDASPSLILCYWFPPLLYLACLLREQNIDTRNIQQRMMHWKSNSLYSLYHICHFRC